MSASRQVAVAKRRYGPYKPRRYYIPRIPRLIADGPHLEKITQVHNLTTNSQGTLAFLTFNWMEPKYSAQYPSTSIFFDSYGTQWQ